MRFVINQKFWSIKDNFTISDDSGRPWFTVEGQFFTIGKKLWLKDMSGNEIFFLKQHVFSLTQKWDLMRGGNIIGKSKGKFFHLPFIRTYKIEGEFGKIKVKGSSFAFNFRVMDMTKEDEQIATISKKILKIADTYVIDIPNDNIDPAIIVGAALIIDAIHHRKH
ncbi:MAG: LURP-one-related family protein [Clostridia bacterium]|nr:LURP-one-related family protein [Clostridia bacterium]